MSQLSRQKRLLRGAGTALWISVFVAQTACVSVQRTIGTRTSQSGPFTSRSTFEVTGGGGSQGATQIIIRPEQRCTNTVTTTTTTTTKVFKKGHAIGALLGAGLLSALVFSLEPVSVEEKYGQGAELCETVLRDYIICNQYFEDKKAAESEEKWIRAYQGVMVAADLVTLWRLARAGKEVRSSEPIVDVENASSTHCDLVCDPVGKRAYLRLSIRKQNWCLDIGRVERGGLVKVPGTFQADQAARLPQEVRSAFLSEPADSLFFKGQVLVPECGEPHDCLFWVEEKR